MGQAIQILGAGISGLVSANLLADAGAKVHVFERRSAVGSFHGKRSIAMLRRNPYPECDTLAELCELGIPYQLDHEVRNEVRISHSYQVALQGRTVLFAVIRGQDEDSLDSFLLRRALARGVTVTYSATEVKASDVHIVASGAPKWSVRGYGQTLRVRSPDPDTVYTIYDSHCIPNGYFCVMPSSRRDATFLAVTFDRPGGGLEELPSLYRRVLSEHPIIHELARGAEVMSETQGGGFCARDPYEHCAANGRIHVGEAAGFLGAARGFGLRYALITGALAARAIISNSSYIELARDYFGEEFQRNWQRRGQLAALTDAAYDQMISCLGGEPIPSV